MLTAALFLAAVQTATAPAPPACATAEHRQFDFWVGAWDVYPTGTDQLVAHSLIERLYDGCVIRENWMPLAGAGADGGSLTSWVPAQGRWRQLADLLWTKSFDVPQFDQAHIDELAIESGLDVRH